MAESIKEGQQRIVVSEFKTESVETLTVGMKLLVKIVRDSAADIATTEDISSDATYGSCGGKVSVKDLTKKTRLATEDEKLPEDRLRMN